MFIYIFKKKKNRIGLMKFLFFRDLHNMHTNTHTQLRSAIFFITTAYQHSHTNTMTSIIINNDGGTLNTILMVSCSSTYPVRHGPRWRLPHLVHSSQCRWVVKKIRAQNVYCFVLDTNGQRTTSVANYGGLLLPLLLLLLLLIMAFRCSQRWR